MSSSVKVPTLASLLNLVDMHDHLLRQFKVSRFRSINPLMRRRVPAS
jgi:hypothetical protein